VHLAHLYGQDGIQLEKAKKEYDNLTGSLLVDHGKNYGIDYSLIDSISNGSIEEVFPSILAYL
jgi:hypothetical protein